MRYIGTCIGFLWFAVPITNTVKMSISVADISANPIISAPLISTSHISPCTSSSLHMSSYTYTSTLHHISITLYICITTYTIVYIHAIIKIAYIIIISYTVFFKTKSRKNHVTVDLRNLVVHCHMVLSWFSLEIAQLNWPLDWVGPFLNWRLSTRFWTISWPLYTPLPRIAVLLVALQSIHLALLSLSGDSSPSFFLLLTLLEKRQFRNVI